MVSRKKEPGYRKLIEAAKAAAELAYRPYSKYNVGAAVLTFDGKIYVGCNVENAGYSQTVHAEETAICNAIADGALKRALEAGLTQFDFITAIAVHAPKGSDPWPCCNCRQFMSEFGLKMDVIGYAPDAQSILCRKLKKLIPFAFPMEEVLASVNGTTIAAEKEKTEEKKNGCGCGHKAGHHAEGHHSHGEHAHVDGHMASHKGDKHGHGKKCGHHTAKKAAAGKCCKQKKAARKAGK